MKLFVLFAAFTKALPSYNEVADLAAAPNATEAVKVIEERMADLLQQQDELNMRHQEFSQNDVDANFTGFSWEEWGTEWTNIGAEWTALGQMWTEIDWS